MTLAETAAPLKRTPLYALHSELGARMVSFAGYEMPVQYPTGILAEHLHTRSQARFFDVSHMGQIRLDGAGCVTALEQLVPGDLEALAPQRMRYTLFLNEAGDILDDLMTTRLPDGLFSSSTPRAKRPISLIFAIVWARARASSRSPIGHCWRSRAPLQPQYCPASSKGSAGCGSCRPRR